MRAQINIKKWLDITDKTHLHRNSYIILLSNNLNTHSLNMSWYNLELYFGNWLRLLFIFALRHHHLLRLQLQIRIIFHSLDSKFIWRLLEIALLINWQFINLYILCLLIKYSLMLFLLLWFIKFYRVHDYSTFCDPRKRPLKRRFQIITVLRLLVVIKMRWGTVRDSRLILVSKRIKMDLVIFVCGWYWTIMLSRRFIALIYDSREYFV